MTYATGMRRASPMTPPVCLGMRPPRRRGQELDLLGLDQGPELGRKPVDKSFVRKQRCPVVYTTAADNPIGAKPGTMPSSHNDLRGIAMVPHLFYYQLALLAIIW